MSVKSELCSSCKPFGYCCAQKLIEESRQLIPTDLSEKNFAALHTFILNDAKRRYGCTLVKDLQTCLGEVKES